MSNKTFITIFVLGAIFSVVVFLYPQIDLYVSQLFYEPYEGFLLNVYKIAPIDWLRFGIIYLSYAIVIACGLLLMVRIFFPKLLTTLSNRAICFVILSFIIVPVFLVDFTFKEYYGRARPISTFSGDKQFTKAWVVSNQCQSNCAFTSGESANAFAYIAFIFLARKRRKLVATTVLFMASFIALMRIAQGGHFFSDVVLSAWFDYVVIWLTYRLLFRTFNNRKEAIPEPLV